MPPDRQNQTPSESYKESGSGFSFSGALDNAERAARIYADIRKGRESNSSAPNPSSAGTGEPSIADQIAAQLSDLIPDSVIDSAGKQGESRYAASFNRRYNPNNVVGKSALAVALSVTAFFIAKKLKIF